MQDINVHLLENSGKYNDFDENCDRRCVNERTITMR